MDIETIAGFVENARLLNRLRAIGVDYAQGFGIHVPRPLEALDAGRRSSRPKTSCV